MTKRNKKKTAQRQKLPLNLYWTALIFLILIVALSINFKLQQTSIKQEMSAPLASQEDIQQTAQTFATICSGDGKTIAMNFAPSEIKTAVQVFETSKCVTTAGINCAVSIAKGQVKSAVTGVLLKALVAAVPEVGPALGTYNTVNGFISAGSQIEKGCINVSQTGAVTAMDNLTISTGQDISGLVHGDVDIPDSQKLFVKNTVISKREGEFVLKSKGSSSAATINGKYINFNGIIRVVEGENNALNIISADFIVGKGGAIVNTTNYMAALKEGTHVVFNETEGLSLPEGQDGNLVKIFQDGIESNILLGDSFVNVKLVNGKYQIRGNHFEVDGIKVYSETGKASVTINEKGSSYTKSKETILETKGIRISGDESTLCLTDKCEKDSSLGKNYVFLDETQKVIKLVSGDKKESEIDFLEGNAFVKTNGKLSIATKENILSATEISSTDGKEIEITTDSMSGITIKNGEEEQEIIDGKLYAKATSVCSESTDIVQCEKSNGKSTPLKLAIINNKRTETPQGTEVELTGAKNSVTEVNEQDSAALQKCEPKQPGLAERCKIWAYANLMEKNYISRINEKEVVIYPALSPDKPVEAVVSSLNGAKVYEDKNYKNLISDQEIKVVYNGAGAPVGQWQRTKGEQGKGEFHSYIKPEIPSVPEKEEYVKVSIKTPTWAGNVAVSQRIINTASQLSEAGAINDVVISSKEADILSRASKGESLSKEELNELTGNTALGKLVKAQGWVITQK